MGMIDENDLKLIGEEMGRVIEDNLLPQLDVMIDQKLEEKLTPIRATMVTKEYLDEKLGAVKGKISVLVDVLHRNRTISEEQLGIVRAA